MPRLLLFDIDGTLIDSNGAGGAAILDAAEEHFGIHRDELPPLQLAGATDPAIAMDVFNLMKREHTRDDVFAFLDRYLANSLGPQGVRVNAISAGPIRTLAASGIKAFGKLLADFAAMTPIRRAITIEDVGNTAAFLLSDLASGISAEIVYVDGGFSHVMAGANAA